MIAARLRASALACAAAVVIDTFVPAGDGIAQNFSIEGIWIPDGSRSQSMPRNPPFTEEGRRLVAEWQSTHDPIEDDPGRSCQSPGMPSIALSGAGYPVEIAVTPSEVFIFLEAHQQVRRVFLDETHPERPFPQRNGHSVGQWDGDTLVHEVTINDPVIYSELIVVQRNYSAAPADTRMLEYECTEAMWIEHQESRGLAAF